MAKTTRLENWRVVVDCGEKSGPGWLCKTDENFRRAATTVKLQIDRHVDDIMRHGYSAASVEVDEVDYCTLCEERWDCYNNGMPGCCEAAADEWRAGKELCPECNGVGCEACMDTGLQWYDKK